ncbi:3-oxoacyl-[acyl-carrier-protein] synthase III C-terminal domain-containing protein [Streptacidiphilus melanogenes]|uniref:3-oxoacyl-[acyl-carrier-protein] synthase III C-terminal domain-containing protein n=1 Tax=Streptacidiphilus melanogenes TaxID=411235 RepID=UPI0005A93FD6|nr:3-oxoacyl-[acyl-carrier-protein] synthase III C-terminal domain-containing protein [Streptacidiphilus melanogenes]
MTAISAVASHRPDTVPLDRLQHDIGLTDLQLRQYERFYGLAEICREPGSGEADLLRQAVAALGELPGREQDVRYVLQARTMPSPLPYPRTSIATLLSELGLRHATGVVVSQHACASGLLALDMAGTLLAADGDPDALALVLAGEKVGTRQSQSIPGVTVMGEGAAAVLVSAAGTRDRMLGYAADTHSRFHDAFLMDDETVAADFRAVYPVALGEVIHAALDEAGCGPDDVALVLPHNVNRLSWVAVCKQLGLPLDRIYLDLVPRTGHCFCADPFINLQQAVADRRLTPGDRYLMTSVGLGATFAAMVLQH